MNLVLISENRKNGIFGIQILPPSLTLKSDENLNLVHEIMCEKIQCTDPEICLLDIDYDRNRTNLKSQPKSSLKIRTASAICYLLELSWPI